MSGVVCIWDLVHFHRDLGHDLPLPLNKSNAIPVYGFTPVLQGVPLSYLPHIRCLIGYEYTVPILSISSPILRAGYGSRRTPSVSNYLSSTELYEIV